MVWFWQTQLFLNTYNFCKLLIFEWLSKSPPTEICCCVIKLLFAVMFILHLTVHQTKKKKPSTHDPSNPVVHLQQWKQQILSRQRAFSMQERSFYVVHSPHAFTAFTILLLTSLPSFCNIHFGTCCPRICLIPFSVPWHCLSLHPSVTLTSRHSLLAGKILILLSIFNRNM